MEKEIENSPLLRIIHESRRSVSMTNLDDTQHGSSGITFKE